MGSNRTKAKQTRRQPAGSRGQEAELTFLLVFTRTQLLPSTALCSQHPVMDGLWGDPLYLLAAPGPGQPEAASTSFPWHTSVLCPALGCQVHLCPASDTPASSLYRSPHLGGEGRYRAGSREEKAAGAALLWITDPSPPQRVWGKASLILQLSAFPARVCFS